jgi:rhodanese-related sulfurtransferase
LDEMLDEAARTVPEVGAREARRMMREIDGLLVLDVRDSEEFVLAHIDPSLNISRGGLEFYIEDAVANRARPILVVSRAGMRGLLAARTLQELGYTAVWNLEGGLVSWRGVRLPLAGTAPEAAFQRLEDEEPGRGSSIVGGA